MTTSLGIPAATDYEAFREEAKLTVLNLAMKDPAERLDALSGVLAEYVGQSYPDVRCDVLKDALDGFAGEDGADALVSKGEWSAAAKAFRKSVAGAAKDERSERYRAAITKEAELTEAVFVDRVAVERLDERYVYATGFGWMQYQGTHWQAVDKQAVCEEVRQYAVEVVADLLQQKVRDPKELLAMLKKTFLGNVVSLAEGVMMMPGTLFDADPDRLNVANGTVDLRTGVLSPHSADDYFTKCAPTDYVPGATDPAWDQALSSMADGVADWMQLRYGNAVTGYPADDQRMCFLNGAGGNGKSLHLDGISAALGNGTSGYYSVLSNGALVAKDADKEAVMSLRGARLAVIEELPEGRHLNVVSLKQVIGTKALRGRHLYQKEMTFNVTHSLFVTSNYDLAVGETDDGTWRRLAKVPFPYTYVDTPTAPHERAKDRTLAARLDTPAARQATLAWLVAGARRWYAERLTDLNTPAAVQAATDAWRADSDMVLRFFDEHLVVESGSHVASSDLLKAFNAFLGEQSQAAWSAKTLVSRFKGHTRMTKNAIDSAVVRPGQGAHPVASRKPSSHYGMDSLPARYTAFTGLRFRTDADDDRIELDEIAPSAVAEEAQAPAQQPAMPRVEAWGQLAACAVPGPAGEASPFGDAGTLVPHFEPPTDDDYEDPWQ